MCVKGLAKTRQDCFIIMGFIPSWPAAFFVFNLLISLTSLTFVISKKKLLSCGVLRNEEKWNFAFWIFEETLLPILQKWEFNAFAISESSLNEIPSEIISLIEELWDFLFEFSIFPSTVHIFVILVDFLSNSSWKYIFLDCLMQEIKMLRYLEYFCLFSMVRFLVYMWKRWFFLVILFFNEVPGVPKKTFPVWTVPEEQPLPRFEQCKQQLLA